MEIQFSDGAYRLFLEFYAGGNIVLTDNELTIIALLRNVSEGAEHEQYKLGLQYNLSLRQNYGGVPPLTKERIRNGLQKAVDRQADGGGPGKKIKKKAGDALRKALAVSITEYPPVLLDHALQVTGFDKDIPPADVLQDDALLDKLMAVFDEAGRVLADITSRDTATGYIIAKQATGESKEQSEHKGLMYDDFHPFKPVQLEAKPDISFLEFSGFNKTVDEFFSSIEGQKLESKLAEREEAAKRKLDQARNDHERRIGGLQQVQELNVQRAQAIEANLDRVEETTAAVNGLIAQGMDWVEIGRLIEMEQSKQNPVAMLIKLPLKLNENTATLMLAGYDEVDGDDEDMADETDSEPSDSEDESTKRTPARSKPTEDKRLAVDIDLALSAWSNARQYYDQRKAAATKQERTQQASTKALKSTEQKITADLKKGLKQEKAVLRPVRKQMWFEKFVYFISSDGYLVLGGKDAQQNEILYRRYLKKGDVYVHADLNGAASVIIKNTASTPDAPIPPSTLSQAGNLSICTSSAWDSKAVMSAWWVNADQVSKMAPTGEYLNPGGFTIKGKKNFLPPAQLLLGFGVMFRISEESKANHVKHRVRDDVNESEPTTTKKLNHSVKDEGSDDDFPDASKHDVGADDEFPDVQDGGDEDDDEFPDVDEDAASVADTDGGQHEPRSNPLLSNGGQEGPESASDDGSDHSSADGDEQLDLESPDHAEEAKDAQTEETQSSGIRHLSAKERRLIRKGDVTESTASERDEASSEAPSSRPQAAAQKNPKPIQPTRGKRGKAKKAAARYADQDEEDRELAMQLLGSRAAQEQKDAQDQEKDAKAESAEAQRARRRAQHEKAQREGLEAEEMRRLNLEEGEDALDEEESAAVTQLDSLVGRPLPGDEILEAIPVCAPWAALGRYKYRVKLQPGALKKGKAVREILGKWAKASLEKKALDESAQDTEKIWPREAELVKGWKEAEIIGVVPVSKVRVMMSGGAAEKGKTSGGKNKGGRGGKGSKKR